jgi:hypothetical protein
MPDAVEGIDAAIDAGTRLKKILAKGTSHQVRNQDELGLMKAVAMTWLRQHRSLFGAGAGVPTLVAVDAEHQALLELSARGPTRARCKKAVKAALDLLVKLRTEVVANPALAPARPSMSPVPDWSVLIAAPGMQTILTRRWTETVRCIEAGSYLAATVMMGAMLEGLLLARVNSLADKRPVFTAASTPRERATGNPKRLDEWTLYDFISVAHDVGWIRQAARDVGQVLRDYRNFIHPSKELSEGVHIQEPDCAMFWTLFQSLVAQLLANAKASP